jgi:hypothetical protein
VKRQFAAQMQKLRAELAKTERQVMTDPSLSDRERDGQLKAIRDRARELANDLRLSYRDALETELNATKSRLYGFDGALDPMEQMAWRDAIQKASAAQGEHEAMLQFAAAALAGDQWWQRALSLVGEQRPWGPAVHKAWHDLDPEVAAVMDEYDELEFEMSDRTARLEDDSQFSVSEQPVLEGAESGGAPRLGD